METATEKQEARSQKPEEWKSESPAPAPSPQHPVPNTPLLDLAAAERFVFLNAGAARYKHVFRPAAEKEWLEYERALRPTITEDADGTSESSVDLVKSAADLWLKLVLRVEGYPAAFAGANWKDLMPLAHRGTAVLGLSQVEATEDSDVLSDSESISVVLAARWNGEAFPRLVHRFHRPTIEHELRYTEAQRRFARRTLKVGGERRPKVPRTQLIQLPNLPTLLALYDELIADTEGYSFKDSGFPGPSPERSAGAGRIQDSGAGAMDLWHKAAAVRELFAAGGTAELEPIEAEERK